MQHKINKAFIFAAGLGTRMRPLTDKVPKPLIKAGGTALLDYQIEMLRDADIHNIALNSHYLADQIKGHLQVYMQLGMNVRLFHEETRLETGGGLLNAMDFINYEPIFTLNSDVIFIYENSNPVSRLAKAWNPEKYDLLLMLADKDKTRGFYGEGDFNIDSTGFVIKDGDKPFIYTGLQIINTEVLKKYQGTEIFSLSEVFKELSAKKRIGAIIHDNYWLHVGDIKGLQEAEDFLGTLKTPLPKLI